MNDVLPRTETAAIDPVAKATAAAARLPISALFTPCDPKALDFATTDDLAPLDEAIGQKRAAEAVRFAMGMRHAGYNLFAFGPAGTGKYDFVHGYAERIAAGWATPPDWCYVHNFTEPHRPKAMKLPAGTARPFHDDSQRLVDELRHAIPAAFESDEYRNRKGVIQEQFKERQEEAFNALQARGRERDVGILRTPVGLALAPLKDGEVLGPKEFDALPPEEKRRRAADSEALQKELEAFLREVPGWEKEQREALKSLNRETTMYAVGHLIDALKARWADHPAVLHHLEAVRDDVIDNADDFLPQDQAGPQQMLAMAAERAQAAAGGQFRRYRVNVFVDQSQDGALAESGPPPGHGAPVIYEDHPTQPSLVGRIEHLAQFGTLVTDFTLIKPGAFHRANGGCLIVDARKLLLHPYAYEAFKRALRSRCIRIESPAESLGWTTTTTLEPEPIPLDLKVVLLGDPMLYYMLTFYDPEFSELFRVAADFGVRMDRGNGNTARYARLIADVVKAAEVRPFDRSAVARIVEQSARLAGDAAKLSTHMGTLEDLVRETDYWAGDAGADVATAAHVDAAIEAKTFRSDSLRERIQEEIHRQTIVIETAGARIGQINGLAVIQLNHFAFGRPSRISCRVRLGKGEVVDIEREVALGGALHSKGVLILSSYLATRYASDKPLSLSASLVFEQSYGGVDGDSASSAELYALISALAGVPIRQSFAVTGSVDQTGRVQAIGGVNEKIESFFDVCAARGLTGDQGVLIPAANVKHLMLRADVVAACADGRFAVYAVETIDQGIEILTGVPAGKPDTSGVFPIGSVNRALARHLDKLAAAAKRASADERRRPAKTADGKERRG